MQNSLAVVGEAGIKGEKMQSEGVEAVVLPDLCVRQHLFKVIITLQMHPINKSRHVCLCALILHKQTFVLLVSEQQMKNQMQRE